MSAPKRKANADLSNVNPELIKNAINIESYQLKEYGVIYFDGSGDERIDKKAFYPFSIIDGSIIYVLPIKGEPLNPMENGLIWSDGIEAWLLFLNGQGTYELNRPATEMPIGDDGDWLDTFTSDPIEGMFSISYPLESIILDLSVLGSNSITEEDVSDSGEPEKILKSDQDGIVRIGDENLGREIKLDPNGVGFEYNATLDSDTTIFRISNENGILNLFAGEPESPINRNFSFPLASGTLALESDTRFLNIDQKQILDLYASVETLSNDTTGINASLAGWQIVEYTSGLKNIAVSGFNDNIRSVLLEITMNEGLSINWGSIQWWTNEGVPPDIAGYDKMRVLFDSPNSGSDINASVVGLVAT
jgi:hypothetical protein